MSVDHKSRNNFVTLEAPGDLVVGYRWGGGWVMGDSGRTWALSIFSYDDTSTLACIGEAKRVNNADTTAVDVTQHSAVTTAHAGGSLREHLCHWI